MADPLSVAGSVAGLLSLAGHIYTTLDAFITGVQYAPSFANHIRVEVDSYRNSLSALHILLSNWTSPPKRAGLIPADFLVLTFTDATLLFSEIEAEVLPLLQLKNFSLLARARWTLKKPQLDSLFSRLQWQKTTLVLQLNILQCASENDAHMSLAALTQNCIQKLADSQDLERRLELVESQLQQISFGDVATIRSKQSGTSNLTVRPVHKGLLDAYPLHHEFEKTLYASWVYRRNQAHRESMSLRSSVIRRSAWSALSELSLAKISVVSVIELPIQRSELFNAQWYPPPVNQEEVFIDNSGAHDLTLLSGFRRPDSPSESQEQIKLGNSGNNHSADAFELTETSQETLDDEVSDSDIIEMEMLLKDPCLGEDRDPPEGKEDDSNRTHTEGLLQLITGTASKDDWEPVAGTKGAAHAGFEKEKKLGGVDRHATLNKALKKANIAVLRDTNQDFPGAIKSYILTCQLLRSVMDSIVLEDRKALENIIAIYSNRIKELRVIMSGTNMESGRPAQPL